MLHNINKRIETVGKQELPTGDSNPRLYISEGETAVNKIKKFGGFFWLPRFKKWADSGEVVSFVESKESWMGAF